MYQDAKRKKECINQPLDHKLFENPGIEATIGCSLRFDEWFDVLD